MLIKVLLRGDFIQAMKIVDNSDKIISFIFLRKTQSLIMVSIFDNKDWLAHMILKFLLNIFHKSPNNLNFILLFLVFTEI